MKLNLQEKIERDFPLNKRELALASGHTRAHLERLHVPYDPHGKITLSEFKRYRQKLIDELADSAKANQFTKAGRLA